MSYDTTGEQSPNIMAVPLTISILHIAYLIKYHTMQQVVIHIAYNNIILPETISLGCVHCACVELYNVVLCTHTVNIYAYTPESRYMCVFHANAGLCILNKIMNAHITALMYVMQCHKSTANPTSAQLTAILATTKSPFRKLTILSLFSQCLLKVNRVN